MRENIQQQADILDKIIPDLSRVFGPQDLEKVLETDIKVSYLPVLRYIRELKTPTMGKLGEATGVPVSTLTRVVDKLVEQGLVAREGDFSDRRVVRVGLTSQGAQIVEKFEKLRKEKIVSVLKHLTSEEREDLVRVVQNIHCRFFGKNERKNEN